MRAEKNMIVMPALIMITLSITGVAVALWSDEIYVKGTIHMADMALAFDDYEPPVCTEFHEVGGVLVLGELCGKDVGETTCHGQGVITDPHTGKWGYENIIITINNAYPGYRVHLTFIVHNIGSIPVDISGLAITDPTGALTWENNKGALVDNNGKPIIGITQVDPVDEQVNPGDKVKSEFDFDIKQDAEECHTYCFEIAIVYTQWGQTVTTPDTGSPDGNWKYYREVEISIDHPENYPILVNLPFAADNSIRFLEDFDGTKDDIREDEFLSYWVDSDNNQRVWVRRLDNFTSSGGSDNAIYRLYEDPLAAPMSSGENTFTYWKDNQFVEPYADNWTVTDGSFSETAGILSGTGTSTNRIVSPGSYSVGFLYESKIRTTSASGDFSHSLYLSYSSENDYYRVYYRNSVATANRYLIKRVGGVGTQLNISDWTRTTAWKITGVWWENTTHLHLYEDYAWICTSDNGNPAFTSGKIGYFFFRQYGRADWFRIRKFVSPEPTTYAGAEQAI